MYADGMPEDEQAMGLTSRILNSDKETWRLLQSTLKVESREQAAELVANDEQAAAAAERILGNVEATMATEVDAETMASELGSASPEAAGRMQASDYAEVLYGNSDKERRQKKKTRQRLEF